MQQQKLPGMDMKLKRTHVKYTKLKYWDENGKPYLVEHFQWIALRPEAPSSLSSSYQRVYASTQ
ncbi:hypothetical protein CVT26_009665 [Gymnopilus dilepis]|uniref:Uncharacterized protein n=1 Tax=Gymnopilus dilepis TaxID=231916 RepID=A0A409VKQ6_9AGAR|nr:hypothetical protein CVT26_009665 [Gymnopilus dilepis]